MLKLFSRKNFFKNFLLQEFDKILLIIVFFSAIFSTLKSFEDGYIVSWDDAAHIVRTIHFYNSLNWETLGIWGWYHGWYLGVAPFIFYPPGFFMIVSFIHFLTLQKLSIQLIIKILVSLTYSTFPLLLYWLARKLEFSRRIAIIASILSLTFSGPWGIGLEGLYSIGLYTNVFSLLLFMLFLGSFHASMNKKGSIVVTGLLLAFIFITNLVTAAYTLVVIPVYLFLFTIVRKGINWKIPLKIFLIAVLSSLFWIYPFLKSKDLWGPETGFSPFGIIELIKKLFLGEIIYPPIISLFLTLGLLVSIFIVYKRKGSAFNHLFIVVLFFLTIVFSSTLMTNLTSIETHSFILQIISRGIRSLLRTRSLCFFWIIVPIIAGIGVDYLIKVLARCTNERVITLVIISFLLVFSLNELLSLSKKYVKTNVEEPYKKNYESWVAALKWLRSNSFSKNVVLVDINWENFESPGTISLDSLVNLEAGLRTLNGNQIEACQLDSWYLNHLKFEDNEEEKDELKKFGVDFILSYRKPEVNTSYLRKVFENRDIIVYKVVGLEDRLYRIVNYELGPNKYEYTIYAFENGKIELPIQYNDHWYANVNGKNVKVSRSKKGLVELKMEKGINQISLNFKRSLSETFCFFVSLFTVIVCLLKEIKNYLK